MFSALSDTSANLELQMEKRQGASCLVRIVRLVGSYSSHKFVQA